MYECWEKKKKAFQITISSVFKHLHSLSCNGIKTAVPLHKIILRVFVKLVIVWRQSFFEIKSLHRKYIITGRRYHWCHKNMGKLFAPDMFTSSRLSQDSAALWSEGISGRQSWSCLPDPGASPTSSSELGLMVAQLDGWAAGAGAGTGLECRSRNSCAAADALSLTGLTSASREAASSARTRAHSFSISLMLAFSCCRGTEKRQGLWIPE